MERNEKKWRDGGKTWVAERLSRLADERGGRDT